MTDTKIITDPNAKPEPQDTAGAPADPAQIARIQAIVRKVAAQLKGDDIGEAMGALMACMESGAKSAGDPFMPARVAARLRELATILDGVMKDRALAALPIATGKQ